MCIGQGERAGFHPSKGLLEKLFDLCCLHIAKDENDAVFCDNITISKFEQIFPSQPLDRIDRAICPQRVRMLREKRLPQDIARHSRQLLFILFDRGNLDFRSKSCLTSAAFTSPKTKMTPFFATT